MPNKDVRDWIDGIKAAGELKIITGAEPKEEIGGIVDIYMRRMDNPAVMFDEIPGFPKGYRVIANILTSIPRVNLALGLPPQSSEMAQIQWWRNYFKSAPSKPTKAVNGGPLLDNVLEGKDVNIKKIPTPIWHEEDGGPYIGTACLVAMKDPDSGWINYGKQRDGLHSEPSSPKWQSPCWAHECAKRSARLVTVRSDGAMPSAISETMRGETNANGASSRICRSTLFSRIAISENDSTRPSTMSSIQSRAFAIAQSSPSRLAKLMVERGEEE